ncbi:MAG: SPOR domain-containing protein [Gammaproteobacteria bacterium]
MDDRLKQRLVGAVVLVALAVIFIPMILDGGRDKTLPPFGQAIPEKPPVLKSLESSEPGSITAPPPPAMIERQLVDDATPPIAADKTTPTPAPAPVPVEPETHRAETTTADKDSKAWVVQVGSFANRKNAVALQDRLQKNNYRAFVEAIKTNGSWIYRVRVGPEVRRSSAEAMQKSIKKKLNINGIVMGHP